MQWLLNLLGGVPLEGRDGICLDTSRPHWEMEGPEDFVSLLAGLQDWLPQDATLYFESGSPDEDIQAFFTAHAVPEPIRVAKGTYWPRPKIRHE